MVNRRIQTFRGTINPLMGGKAGAKDPRNFVSGNIVGQQWDQRQFEVDRGGLDNLPHYADAHGKGTNTPADAVIRTIPTRINYVPWYVIIPGLVQPILVVPRNTQRMDIAMSSPNATDIYYSWGYPAADPTGGFLGTHLAANQPLIFSGGVVPINDLYIFAAIGFAGNRVLAWEGTEALEANM